MVTTYAIRFASGETYIGITNNLDRRLVEHRRRQCPSTRPFSGEPVLLHTRGFPDHKTARRHEVFLKSGAGRAFLATRTTVDLGWPVKQDG